MLYLPLKIVGLDQTFKRLGVVILHKESVRMKAIKCEEKLDSEFTAFLNSLKPNSKNAYGSILKYWINFSHMNGKALLEFRKADKDAETEKLVMNFKAYIINECKKSENYANVGVSAIRGFFTSKRVPLVFTRQESDRLQESNRTTQDYLFAKEDLARMVEQGSFIERYVLLVGKSIGLRAGDFVTYTFGDFRSIHLDSEAPVFLGEKATGKEHIPAYPFLDSDAVQVVKAMLERNPDKKNSDRVLDWDEENLTACVQNLFKKARLESGEKRVRFHNLRKYLIDRLSAVASESQWKQIVGKAISEGAYVSQDQLREVYLRAMPSIIINGNGKNHVKIEALEATVQRLEKEIASKDAEIEVLRKNQNTMSKSIGELNDFRDLIEKKLNIKQKVKVD
jgi:hypothetical protein